MRISLFTLLLLATLFSGCKSDSVNAVVDPGGNGNTGNPVSYANDIQPIFNQSCGGGSCHTSGGNRSGVRLDDYASTTSSVGRNYGTEIVVAGDSENSPLVDVLLPNPDRSQRMPLGGTPLSTSDINLIIDWINEGALDN